MLENQTEETTLSWFTFIKSNHRVQKSIEIMKKEKVNTMFKRNIIMTILTCSICTLFLGYIFPIKVCASSSNCGSTYIISQEIIDERINEQVQTYISNSQPIARVPEYYEYKTEYGANQYISGSGYVGGIPTGGVYFANGGSVSVDITANPTVSVGVSYYGVSLSITMPLGTYVSASAYNCNIPAGGHYRVLNKRTEIIKSCTVYGKNQYGTWVKIGTTYPHTLYKVDFTPVRVS